MKYPEEIYWDNFVPGISFTRQKNFLVERAYDMGKASAKNLEGYSNLTEAIKSKQPIDWERLDGMNVKCVNPDMGELHGALERHGPQVVTSPFGWWWRPGSDYVYTITFVSAWYGEGGWTLYVEGEIPLRRKTAEELPLGMCFEGEYHNSRIELAQVIANRYGKRLVTDHAEKNIGGYAEEEVEVVKEYGIGTFQKPEWK